MAADVDDRGIIQERPNVLGLTRKTDYALVAIARLAEQRQEAGEPLSCRVIADQYGLPLSLLMNVMKDLQRVGLVESSRGARGGYLLARDLGRINLLDVVEAMEGAVKLTPCCQVQEAEAAAHEGRTDCSMQPICPMMEPIRRLNDRFIDFLRQISLADLMESKVDVTLSQVGLRGGVAGVSGASKGGKAAGVSGLLS